MVFNNKFKFNVEEVFSYFSWLVLKQSNVQQSSADFNVRTMQTVYNSQSSKINRLVALQRQTKQKV